MPRRNKKVTNRSSTPSTHMAPKDFRAVSNGTVFRNVFAVGDDVDPCVSLGYLKEVFSGKIDEDVVTMVFLECAYNVEQALESLMALSNDQVGGQTDFTSKLPNHPDSCTTTASFQAQLGEKSGQQSTWAEKDENPASTNFASSGDPLKYSNSAESCDFLQSTATVTTEIGGLDQKSKSCSKDLHIEECNSTENTSVKYDVEKHSLYSPKLASGANSLFVSHMNNGEVQRQSLFNQVPHDTQFDNQASPQSAWNTTQSAFYHTSSLNNIEKSLRHFTESAGNINSAKKDSLSVSNINDISSNIVDGLMVLVILRGLPGSGKSSLAKELKFSGVILSTDDYFKKNGRYQFDMRKLTDAHDWNRKRAADALQRGVTPIIIDNTNTEAWEMLPYVELGMKFQYGIHILEPNTPWKFKPNKLAKKNTHGVPKQKIEMMLQRYDHSVSVKSLIACIKAKGGPKYDSKLSEGPKKLEMLSDSLNKISNNTGAESIDLSSISLEAVVHRDDVDQSEVKSGKDYSVQEDVPENTECHLENLKSTGDENLSFQSCYKITDVNELKQLIREDSEESSVLSQNHELSDSSEEASDWKAITEPDDDFLWTAKTGDDSEGIKTNNNADNLPKGSINLESQNNVNLPNSTDNDTNNKWKQGTEADSNHSDWAHSETREDFLSPQTSTNVLSAPKPPRSSSQKTPITKSYSTGCVAWKEEDNWDDWEYRCTNSNLNSLTSDLVTLNNNFYELNAKDKLLGSKPQRRGHPYYKRISQSDRDISNCVQTALSYSRKAFLLYNNEDQANVTEWALPRYPIDDCVLDVPNHEVVKVPVANGETQTEPSDFMLVHKLETNKLYITTVKTLVPSENYNDSLGSDMYDRLNAELEEIPRVVRLDKSTSSGDIPSDVESSEKFDTLKLCFPEISDDDLHHLLAICHNDSSWLSSILTEWGYKYNMPGKDINISKRHDLDYKCAKFGKFSDSSQGTDSTLKDDIKDSVWPCGTVDKSERNSIVSKDTSVSTVANMEETFKSIPDDLKLCVGSKTIRFVLDPSIASNLQQLFGSVDGNQSEFFSEAQRTVEIGLPLAKILFDKWKETFRLSSASDFPTRASLGTLTSAGAEASAKPTPCIKEVTSSPAPTIAGSFFNYSHVPQSFAEIMDMEYALQLSWEEKLKGKRNSSDMAAVLRRRKLYSMFPGVDTIALDDVFESNNCSLENTVKALELDIGQPAKIPAVAWAEYQPLQDFHPDDWVQEDEPNNQAAVAAESPADAEHWRNEAVMHYQMRHEFIRKAQNAYYRGMTDVASFYAQTGDFHAMKFKAANKRASEIIIRDKNSQLDSSSLDLHGLFVQEAIPVLKKYLKVHKDQLSASSGSMQKTVTVITGRGAHSVRGPKLRPSVLKFLTTAGYRFDEFNSGVVNIHLSSP